MIPVGETFKVNFTVDGFDVTTTLRNTPAGFAIVHHEMDDEAFALVLSRIDDLALEAASNA